LPNLERGRAVSRPLSFRSAAAAIGWGNDIPAGRRLKRLVLAREKSLGIDIATRVPGKRKHVRGVSLRSLLRHLPELRPAENPEARSEAVGKFRAYLEEIDQRLRGVAREEAEAAIDETVRPQIDELRRQDSETLGMLNELAERVAKSVRKD
jgi:hypothetical protein